ncbi:nitroreductase family protein [Haloimpatiens sp. FM7315]|uniref:nitroreductase family protein n=1 Tax=Haloimpatiens sp. FM7315 TaxID=3298609 RepID=UPI0035A384B7
MSSIEIDKNKCIKCGTCADLCKSAKVFKMQNGKVKVVSEKACFKCGQCVAACPKDAIIHSDFENIEAIEKDKNISKVEVLENCLKERRSIRAFSDRKVNRNTINELIDASKYVPVAENKQEVQWKCIDDKNIIKELELSIVNTFKKINGLLKNPIIRPFIKITLGNNKYKKAISSLDSFSRLIKSSQKGENPIFYDAPVVLIAHTSRDSYFGKENSVYVTYNLMLKAQQKGLGTCRIGYFDAALERNSKLQQLTGIKKNRKIQTVLVVGYSKYKFYNVVPREKLKITWN